MSVSAARRPSLFAGIATQLRALVALMVWEGQSSYTQETLGFFWVLAEPLILTSGVIILWSLMGRDRGHMDVSIVAMGLSAYTHIQLWRLGVLPCIAIIRRSAWLYYHPNVHVFDVIAAHILMKAVSIFASFVVIASCLTLVGILQPVRDPGLLVAAYALDTLYTLAFATFIAGPCAMNEYIEQIMHPAMYLTLPLSGAFSLTDWLPPAEKVILEWSPNANCMEMFRAGMFSLSVKTYWSVPLILLSSLFLLAVGLPLAEYARRHIEV